MASTMVALQTVTVGAGGLASVTFSSIPQTYTDLVVKICARSAVSAVNDAALFGINGNTWTYKATGILLRGTGTTTLSASAPYLFAGYMPAATATANTFSNTEIYFTNYSSNSNKSISIDTVQENNTTAAVQQMNAMLWSDPAAITSIILTTDSTSNFTAPASSYVVTSSPGGLTATGGSSPIQIGGLTSGTAYTFTVAGQNPGGVGASSAASNSVTPYDGYESIATAYGSGGSTITFSSIPSTYTHLQLRVIGKLSGSVGYGQAYVQFNGDTAANYSAHQLYGTGSSAASGATVSATKADVTTWFPDSTTANMFGASVTDILDYANTNKYKTIRVLGGFDTNNTNSGLVGLFSSSWRSTAAVSSMSITAASNFLSGTVFELFGIRG